MSVNSSDSRGNLHIDVGSAEAVKDIKNLLQRVRSVDSRAAVRLSAQGNRLAIYFCVLSPATLLDTEPTVLGMRAFPLATPSNLDRVVDSSELLKSLAQMEEHENKLQLPSETSAASWAGVGVPTESWVEVEPVPAQLLHQSAQAGMKAVDVALPQNPGHAVLDTVRSRIWASPLQPQEIESSMTESFQNLPSAVAFAAVVLGFLPATYQADLRRFKSGDWDRINAPGGFVLVRKARKSLLPFKTS